MSASLGPQARTVLALLATTPDTPVPMEDIEDEIWGEHRTDTSRTAVQGYVSKIRRHLSQQHGRDGTDGKTGAGPLKTVKGGYLLRLAGEEIDAELFMRTADRARDLIAAGRCDAAIADFDRALRLWRGGPLFDVTCGPRLTAYQQRLIRMRDDVVEEQAEALVGAGRDHEAVSRLERLVIDDPFRENAYASLMDALNRSGRRSEALGVFLRARTVLREELGIEPGWRLRRMQQTVLSGECEPSLGGSSLGRSEQSGQSARARERHADR